MNAKIFKNIISAIPDDAEIMLEVKADEEWENLKSVTVRDEPDELTTIYLNFSD